MTSSSKYYAKELPDSPVYVLGHPMMFDFLETSDQTLIAELNKCAARGVGGVMEITPETYAEEIKKKELEKLSGNSSKPSHRRTELSATLLVNPGAAVAGSFARRQMPTGQAGQTAQTGQTLPDPITVPEPGAFALPPTAKVKEMKAKVATPVMPAPVKAL